MVNLNGPPFYGAGGTDLTGAVPPDADMVTKALEILTDRNHGEAVRSYLFRPRFFEGGTSAPPAVRVRVPDERTQLTVAKS